MRYLLFIFLSSCSLFGNGEKVVASSADCLKWLCAHEDGKAVCTCQDGK